MEQNLNLEVQEKKFNNRYAIRLEEYENYFTCTFWGPFDHNDFITVGDILYNSTTILKQQAPVKKYIKYNIWGLQKIIMNNEENKFKRFSNGKHDLTVFLKHKGEIKIITKNINKIIEAFSILFPYEFPFEKYT